MNIRVKNPTRPRAATRRSRNDFHMLRTFVEPILFASRWLLAFFLLALVLALVVLALKTGQHIYDLLPNLWIASETDVLVEILGLIDATFAGALVILVIFSGYENFVSRTEADEHSSWPTWMFRIDFTGLKLKLMSAIIVISAIQLLRAFMDVKDTSDRELLWFAGIHIVFVVSAVMLALTDRLSAGDH
jgi:uncharacterized protein (TIGR00645 family)